METTTEMRSWGLAGGSRPLRSAGGTLCSSLSLRCQGGTHLASDSPFCLTTETRNSQVTMGCTIWKLCETINLSSSTLIFSDVLSVRSLSRLHLCSTLTPMCPCSLLVGSPSYTCTFPRTGGIMTGFLPSKAMLSTKQAPK